MFIPRTPEPNQSFINSSIAERLQQFGYTSSKLMDIVDTYPHSNLLLNYLCEVDNLTHESLRIIDKSTYLRIPNISTGYSFEKFALSFFYKELKSLLSDNLELQNISALKMRTLTYIFEDICCLSGISLGSLEKLKNAMQNAYNIIEKIGNLDVDFLNYRHLFEISEILFHRDLLASNLENIERIIDLCGYDRLDSIYHYIFPNQAILTQQMLDEFLIPVHESVRDELIDVAATFSPEHFPEDLRNISDCYATLLGRCDDQTASDTEEEQEEKKFGMDTPTSPHPH